MPNLIQRVARMPALPILVLLTLGLIWGGVTNIARVVGNSDIPPISYAFWTLFFGALVMFVVNGIRRQRIPLSRRHVIYYIAAGLFSSALPTANMFYSLNFLSVGLMSLVLATVPLFTYMLAVAAGLETPGWRRAAGIGLGLVGATIVLLPQGGLTANVSPLSFVIAFLTPLGYASGTVITAKYRPDDVDSLVGANAMMTAAAVSLFAAALLVEDFYSIWPWISSVNWLILLHGALSALAFSLFFVLVRLAGAVYFSQVAYLVTFFGIAIAMLVLGERYDSSIWLALGVTVLGVWLVNSGQPVKPDSADRADVA